MEDFDFIPNFSTSTAAPKIEKKEPVKKQTKAPIQRQKTNLNANRLKMAIVGVLISVSLMIMGLIIMTLNTTILANRNAINVLEKQVACATSESIRLNAALGSLVSADKIQEYAVSVLGMQKAERYQIHYFDDRDGDKVVVSGGKVLNADMQAE